MKLKKKSSLQSSQKSKIYRAKRSQMGLLEKSQKNYSDDLKKSQIVEASQSSNEEHGFNQYNQKRGQEGMIVTDDDDLMKSHPIEARQSSNEEQGFKRIRSDKSEDDSKEYNQESAKEGMIVTADDDLLKSHPIEARQSSNEEQGFKRIRSDKSEDDSKEYNQKRGQEGTIVTDEQGLEKMRIDGNSDDLEQKVEVQDTIANEGMEIDDNNEVKSAEDLIAEEKGLLKAERLLMNKIKKQVENKKKRDDFNTQIIDFRNQYITNLTNEARQKVASSKEELKFVLARNAIPSVACICCNRLLFENQMRRSFFNKQHLYEMFSRKTTMTFDEFDRVMFTSYPTDRLCRSCQDDIVAGKVPRFAISNGLGFPDIDEEIKMLTPTEQLLLMPYMPFLQIKQLQRFVSKPQEGAKGCVIHVPVDIDFQKCLPLDENRVVKAIIKRALHHKTVYSEGLVRLQILAKAADSLEKSPLFQANEIKIGNKEVFKKIELLLSNEDEKIFEEEDPQIAENALNNLNDSQKSSNEESDKKANETMNLLTKAYHDLDLIKSTPNQDNSMSNRNQTIIRINGLTNESVGNKPGNYCYMNSTWQSLANISEIRNLQLDPEDRKIEGASLFIFSLKMILKQIECVKEPTIVRPSRVLRCMVPNTFVDCEQQDASEYLSDYVFKKSKNLEKQFNCFVVEREICVNKGCEIAKYNNGQFLPVGNSFRIRVDDVNMIRLPVVLDDGRNLLNRPFKEVLDKFFENVSFRCDSCKEKIFTEQQIILKENGYLMFQLLIFTNNGKLKFVGPIDDSITLTNGVKCELNSVIVHYGETMRGGHYFCYRKELNVWFRCNDGDVTKITNLEYDINQMGATPYLVIYKIQKDNEERQIDEIIIENVENEDMLEFSKIIEDEPMPEIPKIIKHKLEITKTKLEQDDDNDYDNEPLYDLDDRSGNAEEAMIVDRNFPEAGRGNVYVMAPGEGKKPISYWNIPNFLEFVFVNVFGGHPVKTVKKITYADRIKSYCTSVNPAMRTGFKLLYMAVLNLQMKLHSQVNVKLRRGSAIKLKASDVLNKDYLNQLKSSHEAYNVTSNVRTSPAYFAHAKLDLWAMLRQLGMPTLFVTFSAGEAYWPELLAHLYKVHKGKDITIDEAYNLTAEEKAELIQLDPGTCARYFHERVTNLFKYFESDDGPFGEFVLQDYFIRHEFQMRGSPHIHCILWLKNAPKYDENDKESEKEVLEFIDRFISCLNDMSNPFVTFNYHRHTHTCNKGRKNKKICRFSFPKFPMKATCILDPLPKEERNDAVVKENLAAIKNLICNKYYYYTKSSDERYATFEEMLEELNLTEEQYITAVRSTVMTKTVFLKRRPLDVAVNNYCPQLINVWEANTDIQFILRQYSVVSYILNYIAKEESGMAKAMHDAVKKAQAENKSVKEQYRAASNAFLSLNLMSAQEAFYHCSQLHIIDKSRLCVFIDTNPASDRERVLKSNKELNSLQKDSYQVFQDGPLENYAKRPSQFTNECLAYFASVYRDKDDKSDKSKSKKKNAKDHENGNEKEKKGKGKEKKKEEEKKFRIIRYPKCPLHKDANAYYRQQVMLYLPWTNEETELENVNCKDVYDRNVDTIKSNAKLFNAIQEEELEEVLQRVREDNEARVLEEEENFENNRSPPEEEHDHLASEQLDDKVTTLQKKLVSKNKNKKTEHFIVEPPRVEKAKLYELLEILNVDQRNILMHLLHCFKQGINDEMILMLGSAGTGKSLVIKAIHQVITAYFDLVLDDRASAKVLLAAPTGKAAWLIGGQTLHSALQIKPIKDPKSNSFFLPKLCDASLNNVRRALKDVNLMILDETSMVGEVTLGHVNSRCQQARGNNLPFGGIAVLLVGDFNQLPPVLDKAIYSPLFDNEKTKLSFAEQMIDFELNEYLANASLFELTKVERQKGDPQMIIAANEMAVGKMSQASIDYFAQRVRHHLNEIPRDAIHFFSTNKAVDKYNEMKINEGEPPVKCMAKHKIDFGSKIDENDKDEFRKKLIEYYKTLNGRDDFNGLKMELLLKDGMRYMVTTNIDVPDGLFNGANGTLHTIEYDINNNPSTVWINFGSSEMGRKARTNRSTYINDNSIPDTVVPIEKYSVTADGSKFCSHDVTRIQFPIVAAEATTIHKAQGQTYEKACLHMEKRMTRKLQYVGSSRTVDIKGFYMIGDFIVPKNIDKDDNQSLQITLTKMRQDNYLKFSFENFENKMGFVIGYQNVLGYKSHQKMIFADMWYQKCDVLILSETNMKEEEFVVNVPNFSLLARTNCPKGSNNRGILIFVKNGVDMANIVKENSSFKNGIKSNFSYNIDLHHLRLDTDLHIITGYRSPQAPAELFKEEFDNLLSKIPAEDRKVLIGDFNYDCADMENENAFIKRMKELNLTNCLQVDGFGDRNFTTINNTQIDVVFSNHPYLYAGVYESVFSDHKPIFCEILQTEDETLRRKGLASLRKKSIGEISRGKKNVRPSKKEKEVSDVPVKKEKTTKRKSSPTRKDVPRKKKTVPTVPTVQYSSEKSILNNSFVETVNINNVVTEYILNCNCAFNSITFGFLHAMKNKLFDEALKLHYSYIQYFDLIRDLMQNVENTNLKILNYLLNSEIISNPDRQSVFSRSMVTSVGYRLEQLLGDYYSYIGLCKKCRTATDQVDGKIVATHRTFDYGITVDQMLNLENYLMQTMTTKGKHCRQVTEKMPFGPGFFVQPEPSRKMILSSIPPHINICGYDYTLSFVVSFVPLIEHFVTYCFDGTGWLKYDDLASYAEIVKSREEVVKPQLMLYILNTHRNR